MFSDKMDLCVAAVRLAVMLALALVAVSLFGRDAPALTHPLFDADTRQARVARRLADAGARFCACDGDDSCHEPRKVLGAHAGVVRCVSHRVSPLCKHGDGVVLKRRFHGGPLTLTQLERMVS